MCGIVGVTGSVSGKPLLDIVLEGLKRLEYRGYDSAGVALQILSDYEPPAQPPKFFLQRAVGPLGQLEARIKDLSESEQMAMRSAHVGLGHTRWATHGRVSEENAHPHRVGKVSIVVNGIIENFLEIRDELSQAGVTFSSETDTELVAHLLDRAMTDHPQPLKAATAVARRLHGSYTAVWMVEGSPEVFALKNGAPLVVGRAKGLSIVGSDVAALGGFAKEYAFPKDGTALCLSPKGITTVSWVEKKDFPVELSFQELDWNPQAITKAGYPHFMLKEFFEQPDALLRTLSGHVDFQREEITHPFSLLTEARAMSIRRIFLVGAGSAYHSSLITKYVWEQITGLAVECELSSEFRYRKLALDGSCLCIFISQSGETADSLAALRFARSMKAPTLVVTNVAGSSMTRECDEVFVMRCDAEICVCSTKAFTSQILALNILAHSFAKKLARLGCADERAFVKDMGHLPTAVREAIDMTTRQLASVADWQRFRTYLFIGRGDCYGLALEGALKLKEVTYLHAEGYAAGELKHGPIAVVDAHTLCFAIKGEGLLAQKTLSNMEEVRARGATVIVIGNGDVHLPEVSPRLLPFVTAIPIQYIAYSMAVLMGHDPDRPRNLAKSVTVE